MSQTLCEILTGQLLTYSQLGVIEVPETRVVGPGSDRASRWPNLHLTAQVAVRASIVGASAALVASVTALVLWMSWEPYRTGQQQTRQAAESLTATPADGPQRSSRSDDFAQTLIIVSFGLGAIAGLLVGSLNAGPRHRKETQIESAEKNAGLMAILREMPDGVQVFDREGQLIAWNEQAFILNDLDTKQQQAIVRAPDRARVFRYILARRGDYGPGDPDKLVAAREAIARSGQPMQRRRQGASGRWIEVRGVPTTDGGWLGSYREIGRASCRERV